MAVTATSEHGVFGSARWVDLHGDARPMVRGISEPIIAGLSSDDNAAFARTQGRGHDFRVAAVILRSGQGEAVAEAIHLLGIEGVNLKAALDQRFDHRAVRHFDRDQDLRWFDRATCCHQPGRHLGEALTAVLEEPLADFSTITVGEEHVMALRRPVDAGVPLSLIGHCLSLLEQTSHRDLRRSLYWRSESRHKSGADSPRGIDHGQSDGARVPPRWSGHRGPLVAPDESARFRNATPDWRSGRSRYVSLRFTSRDLPLHAKNRAKGYRGPRESAVEGAPRQASLYSCDRNAHHGNVASEAQTS